MAPLIVTPKLYAPVPPSIASAEYIVVTDTGRLIAALNTVGIVSFPHCSVQWGFSTSTATGVHVDFPIKFQTVLYGIQESHRADLRDDQKTAVIAGADLTGFGLYNSGTTGYGFNWLAIGR